MAVCIVCKTDKISDEELKACEKEGTNGIYCHPCLDRLKKRRRYEKDKVYLFKGRSVKTGEWVEGNLIQEKPGTHRNPVYIMEFPTHIPWKYIDTELFNEVDPDTVELKIIEE